MSPITTTTQVESKKQIEAKPYKQPEFVFVLQLHDGTYVIGQANNCARRIAAINSGIIHGISKPLMVNRIIGIKDITDERNLMTVTKRFCDRYGDHKVITVWMRPTTQWMTIYPP